MSNVPAGWYQTPDGQRRYWDGQAWVETPPVAGPSPVMGGPAQPMTQAQPFAQPQPVAYAQPPAHVQPIAMPGDGAPRKRSSTRRVVITVVSVVGVIALLAIAGIVVGIVFFIKTVTAPVDAVNELWDATIDGDCTAMKELTTSSFRAEQGWETCDSFEASLPDNRDDFSINAYGSSVSNGEASVTADIRDDNGLTAVTYFLVREDGHWVVDGIEPTDL